MTPRDRRLLHVYASQQILETMREQGYTEFAFCKPENIALNCPVQGGYVFFKHNLAHFSGKTKYRPAQDIAMEKSTITKQAIERMSNIPFLL